MLARLQNKTKKHDAEDTNTDHRLLGGSIGESDDFWTPLTDQIQSIDVPLQTRCTAHFSNGLNRTSQSQTPDQQRKLLIHLWSQTPGSLSSTWNSVYGTPSLRYQIKCVCVCACVYVPGSQVSRLHTGGVAVNRTVSGRADRTAVGWTQWTEETTHWSSTTERRHH